MSHTNALVCRKEGWAIRILRARLRGVILVLMIYFFFFLDPLKVHLSICLYFFQQLLSIAFASSEQHSLFLITLRALPLSIRHQLFELRFLSVKIYDKGRARSLGPRLLVPCETNLESPDSNDTKTFDFGFSKI